MIPPSLLSISYYFSLVSIWENEPTEPAPSPLPDGGCDGTDGATPTAAESAAQGPAGDADGVNDQVALRRVFKGYKLEAVPQWEALANSGYERFVENRHDDDLDRARRDERSRNARPATTPAAGGPEQTDAAPPISGDSGA
jgi:hypothetical protein